MSKFILRPDHPFGVHRLLFRLVYAGWNPEEQGPPPLWTPTQEGAAATNAARFMAELQTQPAWATACTGDPCRDWALLHSFSNKHPEEFWPPVLCALRIKFHSPPSHVLSANADDPDMVRWLPGARLNIAECALSGHDPDRPAILWASESDPTAVRTVTRAELARQAQHVADALRSWGISPGDSVAIDMPMVPEAVVAFLGIVLAGCVAVSIADSFAPREIEARLRITRAKTIFTQDVVMRGAKALPLFDRVVEAGAPKAVVLPAAGGEADMHPGVSLREGDLPWAAFLQLAPTPTGLRPHIADSYDVSGVLFSSGTTGEPKAIPW